MPELTDIAFSPTDTAGEIAEKLAQLTAMMQERVRVGELRVGDTTKLDHDGKVTVGSFKMASGDLTNIPLLKYVAEFGKPMIVSTGGGTMDDVERAYDAIMPNNQQLCIMQCTAGYPPAFEELIKVFRSSFKTSDALLSNPV